MIAHTSAPDPAPHTDDDLAVRAVLASARRRYHPRLAERAFLQASEDLTLCSLAAWERLRNNGITSQTLFTELQQSRFLLREAREHAEILAARLEKLDPRRRPHYTPPLRFRILEHMRTYMLSTEETARRFCLTPQTVYNWMGEMRQRPEATTIGSTVVPVPPIRSFSQAVRRLVHQMGQAGFGGKKKIAETLLRHTWRISARSVGRILRQEPPPPEPSEDITRPTSVRGDHPNHLWLMDITRIPTLFPFLSLHLMVVLDACSRLPLAATVRLFEPSAQAAVALLARATQIHGRPRHLVVDQGPQFTASAFRAAVKDHGIRPRYGAVGQTHSLGLIDRFFRTIKESLKLRALRPLSLKDFKRRLTIALIHYSYVRPHSSLGGFTPIEVYYGIRGHLPRPVSPPRGRPADPAPDIPFEFVFLDPEHEAFPVLFSKAA
jgi:transposase InsO family protein